MTENRSTGGPVAQGVVAKVRQLCVRERMFATGGKVLVMVSGGQDSLTLLEILATGLLGAAGPSEVVALHVNHHLRGEESLADEALVRGHCAHLGVELRVSPQPINKADGNVQETARIARREAALAVALDWGAGSIALGHTMDDQVETMLYRLGKYGGIGAIRGMRACDQPWVRPLLGLRRRETELFCRERGIEFAVDRGNGYPGYARTGIREQLVPLWEELAPGAVEAAARTAEVAAEVEQLLAEATEQTGIDVSPAHLDATRLLAISGPMRRLLLRDWLRRHGLERVTRAHVLAVEAQLSSEGSSETVLPGGLVAIKEYDRLEIGVAPEEPVASAGEALLPVPGEVAWGGSVIRAELTDTFLAPDPSREAYIDAGAITGPLGVRGPLPGDRMRPFGAPGRRKLQDILVDLKIPARQRPQVPLVVCGGEILWVCGCVSAEKGRITGQTTGLVRLIFDRSPGCSAGTSPIEERA